MKRINNLDVVRGLCILYVVFYHMSLTYGIISFQSTNEHIFFNVMSFFMIPFYLFSGYLFSSKRSPKEYIINKVNKLIIPYLFWGALSVLIFYIYQVIFYGTVDLLMPFDGFLSTCGLKSNTPLWFFFSLFIVSIVYYFAQRYFSNTQLNIFILLSFIFALIVHNRLQIFSWGNIALGLVYYHIGYYFKRFSDNLSNKQLNISFIIAICIFILINIFDPQNLAFVLLYQREGNFILNLPFSLSACYILWFITRKFSKKNALTWIGENSLVLFASHRIILNWCYDPIIRNLEPNISYFKYMFMGGVIIFLIYITLVYVLKKYIPKVIGI